MFSRKFKIKLTYLRVTKITGDETENSFVQYNSFVYIVYFCNVSYHVRWQSAKFYFLKWQLFPHMHDYTYDIWICVLYPLESKVKTKMLRAPKFSPFFSFFSPFLYFDKCIAAMTEYNFLLYQQIQFIQAPKIHRKVNQGDFK